MNGLLAGLAVILVAVGWLGSVRAGDGLQRTTMVVDGVPLTFVRPATADGPHPGAVVVHGYAGSARLMQPFADTLARNGYVVVLPDLAGHGASTRPLTDPLSDVDVAVRSLRNQSDVDSSRIVLIGHSRGAIAVTEYGGQHPDIAATVALSLGAVPTVLPRNLLVLFGQLEILLIEPARQVLQQAGAGDTAETGRTYGSIADGTAVRADAVPGVEHVSILYSPGTHKRVLAWLDDTVQPGGGGGAVHPLGRLWPAGLLLLGLLVGFVPLAGLALRGVATRPPTAALAAPPAPASSWLFTLVPPVPRPSDLVRPALALAGGLIVAAGVGAVAPDPSLGFAVGGYVALVVVAFGIAALGAAALSGERPDGVAMDSERRRDRWLSLRIAPLVVYAAVMVVVPIQTGVTWVTPNRARLVPLLALLVAAWALFGAAERLGLGRWYLHAVVLGAPLGLLAALAVVGLAPGFLVLVLPLLAALLGIGAGVAAVLRRYAVPWWLTAAVAAPPFAWTAATAFPLG